VITLTTATDGIV